MPYASAFRLGRERPMPHNPRVYPLTGNKLPLSAFVYGQLKRWSRASDIPLPVRMVPRATATPAFQANLTGREGCSAAAAPLKLVPEFSSYIYKHFAAAPPGATLRYVHMGSVAPMPLGGLMSAYQASHFTEGAEDQRIFVSFSKDGDVGQRWTDPARLPVKAHGAQWGPVLHVHPKTGNVWMFYTESSNKTCLRHAGAKYPPRFAPGGDIMVTKTRDGKTWQAPHRIYSMAAEGGIPKVIANSLLVAKTGTWMLPFWRESFYFNLQTPCHTNTSDSHGILISRDDGRTWQARGTITMHNTHLYEGTVAEMSDGSVMMVFRTQLAAAAVSKSWDDGETWSAPMLLTADNPDSKPNVLNIWPRGDVVMAFNDHTKLNIACKNCRSKLSVSRLVEATGGWDHIAQFGPSPSDYLKVHYPSMVQHGCRLLVLYSSMYSCCAPFNEFCDCAPPGAEVGLLLVSFKIWEDKDPVEQMAEHRLKARSAYKAKEGMWGNFWWNDMERPDEVFAAVIANGTEASSSRAEAAEVPKGSADPGALARPGGKEGAAAG
eukprot:jgi/Tetstr1/459089/TSEL_004539.t1